MDRVLNTRFRITAVDPPLGPNHKGLSIRLLGRMLSSFASFTMTQSQHVATVATCYGACQRGQGFISTNYLKVRFGGVKLLDL